MAGVFELYALYFSAYQRSAFELMLLTERVALNVLRFHVQLLNVAFERSAFELST